MDFDLSDEQSLLKATLRQFLGQRYGFRERVAASRAEPGYLPAMWCAFAHDLGLLGIVAPTQAGGMGGGGTEQMVVMEEWGSHLCLEPLPETAFQAIPLLARGGAGPHAVLQQALAGEAILAVAVGEPQMRYNFAGIATQADRDGEDWVLSGRKAMVVAAPWADWLIVAARCDGGMGLFVVPADAQGLTMACYPTIDERRAADVAFDNVRVGSGMAISHGPEGLELLEEWRDRAVAAQAAEAVGLLERMVGDTVAYCEERKQFGQPIASFQALQHRMVDMHIEVEQARAAAVLAACKLDAQARERARAASSAKVVVARACRFVGQNAVQLHGGMGMTDELAIGHCFKRATRIEQEHGSELWHATRLAALMQ